MSTQRTKLSWIVGVGAIAASSLVLAGCTAGGGGNADGVTTVTVMYSTSEFTPEMAEAFEADNPDIKIDLIEYDLTRLNAMITSGDAPDLVRGGASANLFKRGLAAPLDSYIAESDIISEDDLLPVNDGFRWDGTKRGEGELYGLIKDWSPDGTIWQNTKVLEQAGVEPFSTTEPTDWNTILDAARALKAAGVEYPLGVEWQWGISGQFFTQIFQQGAEVYNDDLTEVNLTSPEAINVWEWYAAYGKEGLGPTSLNPLTDGQNAPTFIAGDMGLALDGYWFGGGLQGEDAATAAETSRLIPAPAWGERISPVFGGIGAWIPESSDAKDQAWRVMEYFIGGEPAIERAKSGWGLPGLESLWEYLPSDLPYQQDAIATARGELDYLVPLPDSPYINVDQLNQVLDLQLQALIKGEKSVEDAAAAAEEELNGLLAQGKDQLG